MLKKKYRLIGIFLSFILIVFLYKGKLKANKAVFSEEDMDNFIEEVEEPKQEIFNEELTRENYEYWIEKVDNTGDILLSEKEIFDFNRESFLNVQGMIDFNNLPKTLDYDKLMKMIKSLSIIPEKERYNPSGKIYSKEDYNRLTANLNLETIEDINPIKFGVTINRTMVRTFPTYEGSYVKEGDFQFDRFMETAVYPWEPVAIYLESADEEWYFASIYNYTGWIPKKDIGIDLDGGILELMKDEEFIVAIDRQTRIEDIIFDMGVKIPLKEIKDDSYVIYLPDKDDKGNLLVSSKEISKDSRFTLGHLAYTKENLLKQAFKFYGEAYGWGGMNNTRDCSAFILDVHRTFGFQLPRNTSQQGVEALGYVYEFENDSLEDRIEVIDSMEIGTALYMPGHVMLYIGKDGDEHYAIHQYAGHYELINGKLEYISAMKTDITPITINTSSGETYVESLYRGKVFK